MALFQRRPELGSSLRFTTIGSNKQLLIVGLGNIGDEYSGTRHNIGFQAIDAYARKNDFDPWVKKTDLKCLMTTKNIGETRVLLIKPTTYMNLSGEAVQAVVRFYKLSLDQIIVAHDELDINFGQIRTRRGGGSAGHNGIKSVTQHCGEAYGRVRIGIGPKTPEQIDSADFVLQKFNASEQDSLRPLLQETNAILSEYAHGAPITPETRPFL